MFASEDKPWFEVYRAAMLELDPEKLPQCIVERAGLRVKPNSAGRNAFEINVTKIKRERHTLAPEPPYPRLAMQRAFVVRLGPQTEPKLQRFKGHLEDVDTGEELRFESAAELLGFLGQRFDEARRPANLTNESRGK